MKKNINLKKYVSGICMGALALVLSISMTSCDPTIDSLTYELAEANSKEDLNPPIASFSASVTSDYLTYTFSNTSSSATDYIWDYGDGNTSSGTDGENTFPGEGTYTVTLIATDKLGKSSTYSLEVEVVEPEVPAAIYPEIVNGDFEGGTTGWKPSKFTGASTSAFNASSDGAFELYDGTATTAKTAGAKYTTSTTMVPFSSSTRAGYQEITITPNTTYILEFSYSINTSNAVNGEERVIVEILDGHFSDDAADAYASSNSASGPLVKVVGTKAEGKGTFNTVKSTFTSNSTGLVSIWMYGITTTNDVWADNVKVYPVQ